MYSSFVYNNDSIEQKVLFYNGIWMYIYIQNAIQYAYFTTYYKYLDNVISKKILSHSSNELMIFTLESTWDCFFLFL